MDQGKNTIISFVPDSKLYQGQRRSVVASLTETENIPTIKGKEDAITFAALKMVEQLFHNDKIQESILRSIVEEYADRVDTSKFKCCNR